MIEFQQYMYLMRLIILHYYNVTWLNIPLWIYGKTWTLWNFFNIRNILPKLHQVIRIAYNNNPNVTHGGTITSFNAYHKVTEWFFHHMNDLVLFIRYTRSLDTLELSVLLALLFLITTKEVCMFKFEMSFARCEQCDRVRTSFSFRQLTLSPLPIQGMFYR